MKARQYDGIEDAAKQTQTLLWGWTLKCTITYNAKNDEVISRISTADPKSHKECIKQGNEYIFDVYVPMTEQEIKKMIEKQIAKEIQEETQNLDQIST